MGDQGPDSEEETCSLPSGEPPSDEDSCGGLWHPIDRHSLDENGSEYESFDDDECPAEGNSDDDSDDDSDEDSTFINETFLEATPSPHFRDPLPAVLQLN